MYSMEPTIKCRCGSQGVIPWKEMAEVTEKLAPGGEVPWGECEQCGTFVYLNDLEPKGHRAEVVREPSPRYRARPAACFLRTRTEAGV